MSRSRQSRGRGRVVDTGSRIIGERRVFGNQGICGSLGSRSPFEQSEFQQLVTWPAKGSSFPLPPARAPYDWPKNVIISPLSFTLIIPLGLLLRRWVVSESNATPDWKGCLYGTSDSLAIRAWRLAKVQECEGGCRRYWQSRPDGSRPRHHSYFLGFVNSVGEI